MCKRRVAGRKIDLPKCQERHRVPTVGWRHLHKNTANALSAPETVLGQNQFWPNPRPIHFWPKLVFQCFTISMGSWKGGARRVGGPKFRAFFFPSPTSQFVISSSGGLLVEFWFCLKRQGRSNVHVWSSPVRLVSSPLVPSRHHTTTHTPHHTTHTPHTPHTPHHTTHTHNTPSHTTPHHKQNTHTNNTQHNTHTHTLQTHRTQNTQTQHTHTHTTHKLSKNGLSNSDWPKMSLAKTLKTNFGQKWAKIGQQNTMAKNGLAKIGLAKIGLAKVGHDPFSRPFHCN